LEAADVPDLPDEREAHPAVRSARPERVVVLAALLALVVAGSWLRAHEWSDPWAGMHRAWGGAVYANMARNLLRYDVADTRLGLIASTGRVDPSDFEFYYHHPPLNVWALALSFRALGVSEWSARSVPLAASILSIWLIYCLTAELYSRRAGLAAAALLAFAPAEVYYADHVDPYGSLSLLFTLLAVLGYERFLRQGRARDLSLCLASTLAGCLTTWTPYFAVPLMLVHAAIVTPRARWQERIGLLALPLCGVAAFALFVFHRHLLLGASAGDEGGELYGSLLEKLASRGIWASWFGVEGASALKGWQQHASNAWRLFTVLPLALFATWLFDFARRGLQGTLASRDGIAWILIGYGLLHNLAFPGTLHGHDFLVRCYSAGLALTGGVALARGFDWLRARGGVVPALAASGFVLAGWLVLTVPRVAELRERSWDPESNRRLAATIQLATRPETRVLLSRRSDRVLQYYIDRPVEFGIATPERLMALAAEGRDAVWIATARSSRAASRALAGVVHSKRRAGELILYRIEATGPDSPADSRP